MEPAAHPRLWDKPSSSRGLSTPSQCFLKPFGTTVPSFAY